MKGTVMKLELFKRDSCPYCMRVQMLIEQLGVGDKIEQLDITSDASALQRLIEVGGKRQVPCLFIDNVPLYESSDIMAWIKKNLG